MLEMAAGAAHELNNPLAVIAGRAQLLAEAETSPQKKQDLAHKFARFSCTNNYTRSERIGR